jgi:hypothetical protein
VWLVRRGDEKYFAHQVNLKNHGYENEMMENFGSICIT